MFIRRIRNINEIIFEYFIVFVILYKLIKFYIILSNIILILLNIGDWGLGIGDWGLGIGDWAQSPIPNPQSPIPIFLYNFIKYIKIVSPLLFLIRKLTIVFKMKQIFP